MFPTWTTLKYGVLSDLFKKGEETRIGERDFRIPVELQVGGREGIYDPQMGDMGRGQPGQGTVMTGSYFSSRMSFEIDMLSIKATEDRRIAVTDPFKRLIAQGFFQYRLARDKWYHGDGTAVLATATSQTGTPTVYTCDTNFGAQLVRVGQYVTVYDTSLATIKGLFKVTSRNTTTRTVTLDAAVPSAANTDKLCIEGVSGSSPVGIRGLDYWLSTAASGTTAGLNRANVPAILSKTISGSSGPLLAELPMVLKDRILMDRGEFASELLGIMSPVQRGAIFKNVMAIQKIDITAQKAQIVDRLPALKGKQVITWGDTPHYVDAHAKWTTCHYIIPSLWGKAQLDTEKFYETPGSKQRFHNIAGGSGAPRAGVWFALTCDEDLYTVDPGAQGLIPSLSVDALYTT